MQTLQLSKIKWSRDLGKAKLVNGSSQLPLFSLHPLSAWHFLVLFFVDMYNLFRPCGKLDIDVFWQISGGVIFEKWNNYLLIKAKN